MNYDEYNNNFWGYDGKISRKNYTINMLILIAMFLVVSFINYDAFFKYTKLELLSLVLNYVIWFFKFIILLSGISLVYRRIADISANRSNRFFENMRKIFILLFVFPVLYLFCLRIFLNFLPFLVNVLDLLTIFIITPVAVIFTIVICLVKGKTNT